MKKQVKPQPIALWKDPKFIYKPAVATNVLETLKRFGFVPPSEKEIKQ